MAVSAKKNKPARKPAAPKENAASRGAKKQMWAVILFALGILLGAITFIEGARLWNVLHSFLFGMFGLSAYFWAPLIVYIAVIAAMDKPFSSIKAKLWQVIALLFILAGAFTVFGPGFPGDETFAENAGKVFRAGTEGSGF